MIHPARELTRRIALSCCVLVLLSCSIGTDPSSTTSPHPSGIDWQDFTPQLFESARAQHRLVLLDLGTGWCHWCHVMEETTYADPVVVELVRDHYLAARVDADSRVDLANRYEDYGWPATILFDAKATELVKWRGYIEPGRMAALLKACVDDPTPGPSARADGPPVTFGASSLLSEELRQQLEQAHAHSFDAKVGAFAGAQKFLPEWSVEHDLERALRGDAAAEARARSILAANRKLIDPAWGGVYQYSHGGDWDHPHFEKIMSFQSLGLRLYSQAYAMWKEESHRKAAQDIHRYLVDFLRDDAADSPTRGAFFTSQDADLVDGEHGGEYFALDDAKRRALGMPRIDRNVYARENGWAIEALALLHEATGDPAALAEAEAAARVMLATRRVEGGGFRHGERDRDAIYLGDTLGMGAGLLELYFASGERTWFDAAAAAADCIERTFGAAVPAAADAPPPAGYPNARPVADATGAMPGPQRDENLALARFTNLLFKVTTEPRFDAMTRRALRYLVTPAIATRPPAAAVVLVAQQVGSEPIHVIIVGRRDDATARSMFTRALRIPTRDKIVEFWSPNDAPLPSGVNYPNDSGPSAYVCVDGACFPPVSELAAMEKLLERGPRGSVLPRAIPVRVEKVAEDVSATTVHGWNTCRLVRSGGALFASAALSNPKAAEYWDHGGAFFRQDDGGWKEVGRLPFNPYTMAVGPDGRFWVVAPPSYTECRIYRSRAPGDLSELEEVHRGTCSYLGAAIGPEGNFVVLYAESADSTSGTPNAVTADFYERASDSWHRTRIATPEGRYGYEGIVLRGRRAIAVLNSSLTDPDHSDAKGTNYSWRHVRLARCEDLTKGEWIESGWLLPQDGKTALQDLIVGPDGDLYLSYCHVAATSHAALHSIDKVPHRIARIHADLSVETFETGLEVGAARLLFDPNGGFHLVGRSGAGGLRLWNLDRTQGFRAGAPRELEGTDAFEDYVVYALCPERFGGESGEGRVHLLGTRSPPSPPGKERADVDLWLASFRWADL